MFSDTNPLCVLWMCRLKEEARTQLRQGKKTQVRPTSHYGILSRHTVTFTRDTWPYRWSRRQNDGHTVRRVQRWPLSPKIKHGLQSNSDDVRNLGRPSHSVAAAAAAASPHQPTEMTFYSCALTLIHMRRSLHKENFMLHPSLLNLCHRV